MAKFHGHLGHTHSDNFYMVYTDPKDASSRPTSVVYAAPSATTYSEYNPAYRIYSVDGNYPGSTYVSLISLPNKCLCFSK